MMHTLNKLLEERHRLKQTTPIYGTVSPRYIKNEVKLPNFMLQGNEEFPLVDILNPKISFQRSRIGGSLSKRESLLASVGVASMSPLVSSDSLPAIQQRGGGALKSSRISIVQQFSATPDMDRGENSLGNLFLLTQLVGEATASADRAERLKEHQLEMTMRKLEQKEFQKSIHDQIQKKQRRIEEFEIETRKEVQEKTIQMQQRREEKLIRLRRD